jgi:putative ABC transport system substrate-binding protein
MNALMTAADAFLSTRVNQLVDLADRNRIPTIYSNRDSTSAGGLVSYRASRFDAFRLAGVYTARILKGEKPADLPVLQASKFELMINLKTAKALGLDMPAAILARADDVIE